MCLSQMAFDAHVFSLYPMDRAADISLLLFAQLFLSERLRHFRMFTARTMASLAGCAHEVRRLLQAREPGRLAVPRGMAFQTGTVARYFAGRISNPFA